MRYFNDRPMTTNDAPADAALHELRGDITEWLVEVDRGEAAGADISSRLFAMLYDDLHRMARRQMRKESPAHTLGATGLTHEAWLRMSEQTRTRWASRSHFMAVASTMMRRILVHYAAARKAQKRDAILVSSTFGEGIAAPGQEPDVIAIHEALLAFEAVDPRAARIVELRFFGGMENAEIAEATGLSVATVKRDWNLARAWLLRELKNAS